MKKKTARRSAAERSRRRARQQNDSTAGSGPSPFRAHESSAANALTTFWMLCVLASLVSLVVSLVFSAVIDLMEQDWSADFRRIPTLVLFVGSCTGILGLLLTWPVRSIRQVPVPTTIVLVAVISCSLPIALRFWVVA